MNDTNSLIHMKMELQIPHRICAKIQKKNLLQGKETGSRKNPENAL